MFAPLGHFNDNIMKKLLFIPMLFACYLCIGQTDSASIIGESINLGNLVVAQHVFPEGMSWDAAKRACKKLGRGWRLPTKDELNIMYQNKDSIGGFAGSYYWSSTELDDDYAWRQNFTNGSQNILSKDNEIYVRAIRAF